MLCYDRLRCGVLFYMSYWTWVNLIRELKTISIVTAFHQDISTIKESISHTKQQFKTKIKKWQTKNHCSFYQCSFKYCTYTSITRLKSAPLIRASILGFIIFFNIPALCAGGTSTLEHLLHIHYGDDKEGSERVSE